MEVQAPQKKTTIADALLSLAKSVSKLTDSHINLLKRVKALEETKGVGSNNPKIAELSNELTDLQTNMEAVMNAVSFENAKDFPPLIKKQAEE